MKSLDVPFDHSVTGCAIRILFTLWQIADSFPSQDFPNVSSSPLQLTINISESRLPEKEVANLTNLLLMHGMRLKAATQNDSQQAAKLNFELLDISTNLLSSLGSQQRANFIGVVHLDPVYGIIRFTAPIDRERLCPEFQGTNQPCNINLIVVAHQMFHQIQQATKHPPKIGPLIGMVYIDLTVTVLDINDNAPYFPKLSTADGGVRVILISEECKLGTLISLPMASDADSIEHGVRSYLFHPLSTPLEVLEHFQIVLIPGLGTQCEHLDPRVLDHATIMDDQDTHSGTLKKTVEQITPCLQVIQRIDRERIDRFSFRLIALDSDDNRGEVVIRLIVRDINDHAPTWLKTLTVFDSSGKSSLVEAVHLADSQHVTMDNRTADRTRYEFGVKECTAQRKLVQLKAVDLDDPETENGKVTYQIIEQSADIEKIRRRFFISREYVYITELGLRGLRHGNLSLLIVASDGAGAVSEAEIVLHIEDCNDHRPMILIRNSEFIVPEDTYDKPHLIGLVTVRDLDLTTSPNSIFRCSLNDSRYLALKEVVTGPTELVASVLTEQIGANRRHLASPTIPDSFSPGTEWKHQGRWSVYRLETQTDAHFDREEKAFYSASLQCADNGVPSLSSTRLITIHISDVNDNPPEFYQEDDEKNTHLPTYHINQIDPFWPIPTSNPVAITHSVEKQSLFEFSILENAERGSFIGRLHARDRDIGENARLTFEIIPANETLVVAMAKWPTSAYGSDSFTVSVTGELHLIKQLDREEQSKYLVLVRVRDHGTPKSLSATATVVVNVADVNDCPPEFHGEYIFEVVESYGSSTIHQILGSLNATDADLGRNGSVSYRIATSNDQSSGLRNHFAPDHTVSERPGSNLVQITQDGQIKIYGILDREQFPMVMVDVIAEDNGTPTRLSSMITLTIHVLDLNDNKPRFVVTSSESSDQDVIAGKDLSRQSQLRFTQTPTLLEPVHILNISLDTSIGTVLVKFEAVDPDEGPNGTVVYELIHPASSATYRRDSSTAADKDGSPLVESSDYVPAFTLHSDGRLVLSKQLTFDEIYSPSTQSATKRYRRPDKLLIRATDRGPTPEQAITGVHLFYHDPLTAFNAPTAVISQAVSDYAPDAVRQFNEPIISLTKSTANNLRTPIRAHPKPVAHNTGAPGNGIPIIYMLALAVFFALVLVVASLIYLYTKVKKPNRATLSHKNHENSYKPEINGSRCVNRCDNAFGAIRMDGPMKNDSSSGSTENDLALRYPKTGSSPLSDRMTSAEHYRTLSPSYLKRDVRDSQFNKNGSDNSTNCAPQWNTTLGPGYTELTACHVFHSSNSTENSPRATRYTAEHLHMPFTSHYPPVMINHPQRQPTFLESVHISHLIPQVNQANHSISQVNEKPIKTFANGYSNPMPSLAGSFHPVTRTLSKTCTPVSYDDLSPTDDLLRSKTSCSTTSNPYEKNQFVKNKPCTESVPSIKESTGKPNICHLAASFV